jgi:alpha-mannosidase
MHSRLAVAVFAAVLPASAPVAGARTAAADLEPLSSLPPDRLVERVQAEVTFAEGLLALHPDRKAEWTPLLEKARALAGAAASPKAVDAGTVGELETLLAPIGAVARTYTVHNVGHAHIDMNWMWPWTETVAVTNDTFTTVLRLMDEFPDFRFTQSQASVYEIARRYNPALFERIKARVAEGRWEVVASQWVEGDKNLVSGEAIARHLLYTRRFVQEELGLGPEDVPIDWSPDTFGHAATIPTLVSRGGVTRYYMCRGGRDEKPPVFWWRGPDGSRVLVNLETTWYLKAVGPENASALLAFAAKTGLRDWMNVYGVGDHGGGPTRRDIRRILEMDGWPVFPRFRFATTREFYAILEKGGDRLPVLDRELNFEFTGCYTSQSQIKQHNRLGESRALDAEAAAVLALRAVGRPYPAAALREAWTNVLFGHFHDILPGSGVRATREYQSGLFQQSAATFGTVQAESLRAVAAAVDTAFAKDLVAGVGAGADRSVGAGVGRGSGLGAVSDATHQLDGPRPVIVFNPTAWPREEVVRATVWDSGASPERREGRRFVVHAAGGRSFPAAITGQGEYWGHRFVDVVFPVSVAALGYAAYVLEERAVPPAAFARPEGPDVGASAGEPVPQLKADADALLFENDRLSVRFDRTTGGIVQLVDRATGLDLAVPGDPLGLLEFVVERPRDMSAWVIGDTMSRTRPLPVRSLAVESGAYFATLVAKSKVHDSDLTVRYSLRAGEPWVAVEVEASWLERGGPDVGTPQLRMVFPTRLEGAKARYEVPYGSIVRALARGEEVPSLRYADAFGAVTGRPAGLLLLNDGKHGHSLDGSTLALTLLRSSYEPDPLPEIGAHTVRMALVPHGGALSTADMTRLAAAFNHPLQAVSTDVHPGRLAPGVPGLAAVSPADVVVGAVKKAEADGSIVFRLVETAGRPSTARLALAPLLGIPSAVEEIDFLERPLARGTARIDAGAVLVDLPAHGIASVRVRFE